MAHGGNVRTEKARNDQLLVGFWLAFAWPCEAGWLGWGAASAAGAAGAASAAGAAGTQRATKRTRATKEEMGRRRRPGGCGDFLKKGARDPRDPRNTSSTQGRFRPARPPILQTTLAGTGSTPQLVISGPDISAARHGGPRLAITRPPRPVFVLFCFVLLLMLRSNNDL